MLAVVFEVLPTEADVLFVFARSPHKLIGYLVAKLVFLAIILFPISIYSWLNGWRALKIVKARAISVGVAVRTAKHDSQEFENTSSP